MELPRHEMEVSASVTSRRTTPDWEAGFEPGAHADEVSQVAADEDFSQLAPDKPSARPSPLTLTSGLVTGADLLAKNQRPRISPNAFRHGMAVEHPTYGAGTIIALSGDGPKRTATVRFFDGNAERKFRLLHSDLMPAEMDVS
jgi:DNA helicase-2/ATP-dependent DNA helicase PcrA